MTHKDTFSEDGIIHVPRLSNSYEPIDALYVRDSHLVLAKYTYVGFKKPNPAGFKFYRSVSYLAKMSFIPRVKVLKLQPHYRTMRIFDYTPTFNLNNHGFDKNVRIGLVDAIRSLATEHGCLLPKHAGVIEANSSPEFVESDLILASAYPVMFDILGCASVARFGFSLVSWAFRQRTMTKVVEALFGSRNSGRAVNRLLSDYLCYTPAPSFHIVAVLSALRPKNRDVLQSYLKLLMNGFSSRPPAKQWKELCRSVVALKKFLSHDRIVESLATVTNFGVFLDTCRMSAVAIHRLESRGLQRLKRCRSVTALHDRLSEMYRYNRQLDVKFDIDKSPAKLLDGAKIGRFELKLPVSSHELYEWGSILGNCLPSYVDNVARGESVILGLSNGHGVEYVLELARSQFVGGIYVITQFSGLSNLPPPPDVVGATTDYLLSQEHLLIASDDPQCTE